MASNPKRVSFGSDGSLVKTLIFEAEQDHVTSAQERRFYDQMKYHLSPQHKQRLPLSPIYRPRPSTDELIDRDNPFHVGGELRRKADLMLARSRITRSELRIFDPDLTQSTLTTQELAALPRQRPVSECLPSDHLPLCDVLTWTRPVNGEPCGGGSVTECCVERLDADDLPTEGRAVTVTVFPDRRTKRSCCAVS